MGKIGFRLRSKASNQANIFVYLYTIHKKRLESKTGFSVLNSDWDQNQIRLKIIDQNAFELNQLLDQLERHLIYQLNLNHDKAIDKSWLETQIAICFNRPVKNDELRLVYQIDQYIESSETRRISSTGTIGLSYNTVRSYVLLKKIITEYENNSREELLIDQLDKSSLDQFQNWLLKVKRYSVNNSGHIIKQIKTVCNEAQRNGHKAHPYLKFLKGIRKRSSDRLIHTIDFEEIKKIKSLENLSPELENVRKWMLIGFYAGQRVSDLLKISKTNVRPAKNGLYIDLIQQNTQKYVTIGINDPITVDVILNHFPTSVSPIKFNRLIKEICKRAGMNELVRGYKNNPKTKRKELGLYPKYELICAHDLRRSFATNYFGKVETPILMQITGHTKESTFLKYIGANPNKDAIADLFMEKIMSL